MSGWLSFGLVDQIAGALGVGGGDDDQPPVVVEGMQPATPTVSKEV
jgi:hypothetical protein